jgi:hypothetical protein
MKIVGRLWRRLLLRVFPRKTHRERKIDRNRVYWWREKSKKKKQLDKDRQAVKRRLETNGSLKRARKGKMKAAKSHQKSRFGICASLSSWFVFLLLKMTRTRLVVDYHRLGRERGGQKNKQTEPSRIRKIWTTTAWQLRKWRRFYRTKRHPSDDVRIFFVPNHLLFVFLCKWKKNTEKKEQNVNKGNYYYAVTAQLWCSSSVNSYTDDRVLACFRIGEIVR